MQQKIEQDLINKVQSKSSGLGLIDQNDEELA